MKHRIILLLCVLIVLAGLAFRTFLPQAFPYPELKVFSQAYMLILTKFVDPVKDEALLTGADRGLMNALDPFSFIVPAARMKAFHAYLEGRKDLDCGVELRRGGRFIYAMRITPGSPADGTLKPGDIIEVVDGLTYPQADAWEMQNALSGTLGSSIKIRYTPREQEKSLETTLVLKPYPAPRTVVRDIEGVPMAVIPHFKDDPVRALKDGLRGSKERDLLFVDLRGNDSFDYSEALAIAALFTKESPAIVFKTRKGDRKESASGQGLIPAKELWVVTDRDTTGAGEILAALLKKYAKAKILGRATFGYTGLQSVVPMSDGGACYLTTTIAGLPEAESLMHKGVQPDLVVKETGTSDQEGGAIDKKIRDLIHEKAQKKAA